MSLPFSDYEKRFLLAEIIKASNVAEGKLLQIIMDENIEPNWNEIWVPPARNLRACSEAFQELLSNSTDGVRPAASFEIFPQPSKKRRYSATERVPSNTRIIQPKPAANCDPGTVFRSTSNTSTKKRGRPSKVEIAIRQAEAAARGEVYPPPKTTVRKSSGVSQPPTTIMGEVTSELGLKTSDSNADSPIPPKKKRGRPSKDSLASKKPFDLNEGQTETFEMHKPVMGEDSIQPLDEPTPGSDVDHLRDIPGASTTLHTLLEQFGPHS